MRLQLDQLKLNDAARLLDLIDTERLKSADSIIEGLKVAVKNNHRLRGGRDVRDEIFTSDSMDMGSSLGISVSSDVADPHLCLSR